MHNFKRLAVLPFLLALLVVLSPTPSRSNAAPFRDNQYTQLKIGDILFGKSKALKLKLFGSTISFDGIVLKAGGLKSDEIVVYRIVIVCCAADGVPLGIVVKMPAAGRAAVRNGDWVKVTGTLKLAPFNPKLKKIDPVTNMVLRDKTIPYFVATKVAKVKTPNEQYLYP
jgi:hypothetical protein